MAEEPEKFIEYSDWMGIPIQPYPISLDLFKALLLEVAKPWPRNQDKYN